MDHPIEQNTKGRAQWRLFLRQPVTFGDLERDALIRALSTTDLCREEIWYHQFSFASIDSQVGVPETCSMRHLNDRSGARRELHQQGVTVIARDLAAVSLWNERGEITKQTSRPTLHCPKHIRRVGTDGSEFTTACG